MLRDRLGVSERWACRVVGQHRSTQRHEPKTAGDDVALRAELRQFSKDRPRWGYRRAHHHLRALGWAVNRKRVQRLWREEGLRVPVRRRKRRRLGDSTVPAERLLGEGKTIPEAAKELGISEQTYHRWRNQYGGMKAQDAKRLKELERENVSLKAIVADQALENRALKEIARGNW